MAASWYATPRVNNPYKRSQMVTGPALALSHGTNDSQKTMGIITVALVTSGYLKVFAVPAWVILMCASVIAFGTATGGWSLIRTLGAKFYRISPIDGLRSRITSAAVIIGASLIGGPVSTMQVLSSSIMGVGGSGPHEQGLLGCRPRDRHRLGPDSPGISARGRGRLPGNPLSRSRLMTHSSFDGKALRAHE